jgi:hypothetical protein
MQTIRLYKNGKAEIIHTDTNASIIEIILDDGRTAEMYFTNDGKLSVRAWGNIPAKLGNSDNTAFRCNVIYEEATNCEKCYNLLNSCTCT